MKTENKVEINVKLLEKIAEYYEFPLAVFFMQPKDFPKGRRVEHLWKKCTAYDKIVEIVEEERDGK